MSLRLVYNHFKKGIIYGLLRYYYLKSRYNVKVLPTSKLSIRHVRDSKIKLGSNVIVGEQVKLSGSIDVGTMTYLSDGPTDISSEKSFIKIGSYCSIASGCFMRTSCHFLDRITTSPRVYAELLNDSNSSFTKGPIIIDDDVWVGANVTILGGVTIGRGAIIGAGSVVTSSVEKYCIYAGTPARLIAKRKVKVSNDLKESWTNLSPSEILKNKDSFY